MGLWDSCGRLNDPHWRVGLVFGENEMIIWVTKVKPSLAHQACVLKNEMITWVCETVGLWDCGTVGLLRAFE